MHPTQRCGVLPNDCDQPSHYRLITFRVDPQPNDYIRYNAFVTADLLTDRTTLLTVPLSPNDYRVTHPLFYPSLRPEPLKSMIYPFNELSACIRNESSHKMCVIYYPKLK